MFLLCRFAPACFSLSRFLSAISLLSASLDSQGVSTSENASIMSGGALNYTNSRTHSYLPFLSYFSLYLSPFPSLALPLLPPSLYHEYKVEYMRKISDSVVASSGE